MMKMHWIRMIIGCLLLASLTACAAATPDWIGGKSAAYDDEFYLTGVGFDKKRTRAEDRARSEIAKIFEVNVLAKDSISESSLLTKLGDANREEYKQSASSSVETTTDKMLRGVKIAELYKDEDSGKTYALATLERVPAARGLKEELASIDRKVGHLVSMAEESSSPLVQLSYYLKAIEANKGRSVVAADLRITDPSGWATPAKHPQGKLVAAAERAANSISVEIDLKGDKNGIVDGALVRALNDIGMQVVTSGANIAFEGRVDTEEYKRQGLNWVVASAQVEFVTEEGRRLDSVRTKTRDSSQIKEVAGTRAFEQLGDKLAGFLVQRIGKMGSQ